SPVPSPPRRSTTHTSPARSRRGETPSKHTAPDQKPGDDVRLRAVNRREKVVRILVRQVGAIRDPDLDLMHRARRGERREAAGLEGLWGAVNGTVARRENLFWRNTVRFVRNEGRVVRYPLHKQVV